MRGGFPNVDIHRHMSRPWPAAELRLWAAEWSRQAEPGQQSTAGHAAKTGGAGALKSPAGGEGGRGGGRDAQDASARRLAAVPACLPRHGRYQLQAPSCPPHLELGVGEGLARLLQAVLVLVLPVVDDLGALVEQQHLFALADPGAGVQRRLRTTGG